jgi:hypothetical protein
VDRLAPCPGDSKAKLQMQASTPVQVELAARENNTADELYYVYAGRVL